MSKVLLDLNSLSDIELIILYKNGNETAGSIILYRYKGFSYMLARAMHEKYGGKHYLEIEDLASVAMCAVFVAIEKFDGKSPFYPYWKRVATNQLSKYIGDMMSFFKNVLVSREEYVLLTEEAPAPSLSSGVFDKEDLIDQVLEYLKKNKKDFSEIEIEVFTYYLDGYTYVEISEKTGLNYNQIRKYIEKIKKHLKHILRY